MVEPRVAELGLELIDRRVFENDLDALRTAKRLVRELDRIALEDSDPRAARETIKALNANAARVGKLPEHQCRRCEGERSS
jgi:hypothetical protein